MTEIILFLCPQVLSKEAGSNQLKIQECIHLCELYADSDDNDNTAKELLGTMTHLQSEVRQISKLIIERLEALQVALHNLQYYKKSARLS